MIASGVTRDLWLPRARPIAAMTSTGRGMRVTLVNAMHITASVLINDDESGLHHDYEVWLERLAPHAPIERYWRNRTGEDAGPGQTGPPTRT